MLTFGTGDQTGSLCYVGDLTDGLVRPMRGPEEVAGSINPCHRRELSIGELAETIRDMTGSRSELVFRPAPEDDPMQRKPDIAVAERHSNWKSRTLLEDGQSRTIAYFDTLLREGGVHRPLAHGTAAE